MRFSNYILSAIVASTVPAVAQESASSSLSDFGNETSVKNPQKVEKIEVTGSHIKRINIEGANPVTTLDRERIEQTGFNSVADVLRDIPSNSFGSAREQSGSNAAGQATINLRGLGAARTLVLINGKRIPMDAVTGAADLNLIPIGAVQRVDVLKDGASATYGSDALGGVVNIVTKKDFEGGLVSMQSSTPQETGGTRREISGLAGFNTSKTNAIVVMQYRDNERLFARDRTFSRGGQSTTAPEGSYAGITDGKTGNFTPSDRCSGPSRTFGRNTYCTYDYTERSTTLPDLEHLGIFADATTRLSGSTQLRSRMLYNQRKVNYVYAPAPLGRGTAIVIPSEVQRTLNNGAPLPGLTADQDALYMFRASTLGDRVSEIDTTGYGGMIGITREVGATWEVNADVTFNRIDQEDVGASGFFRLSQARDLVTSGAYNPYLQTGDLGASSYSPTEVTRTENTILDVIASGEAFELGNQTVSMAVGMQSTREYFSDILDQATIDGDVIGSSGSNGEGGRSTYSLFTEMLFPVSDSLELTLAARYDNFSDFGETLNPKLSMRWQASQKMMVRSSVGTGYKAPTLQSLFRSQSQGFVAFVDRFNCPVDDPNNANCESQQYETFGGGNRDLKEETSLFANLGTVIQPNRNFSFGVDTFYTKINDVIVPISGSQRVLEEVTRSEGDGSLNLSDAGISTDRDPDTGELRSISAPFANLAAREISGYEIFLEGQQGTRIGRFALRTDYSQLFYYKEEVYPGTGLEDRLGENGFPKWRSTTSLNYSPTMKFATSLIAKTIGTHEKDNPGIVADDTMIQTYTEYDVQATYLTPWSGKMIFGIQNALQTRPEFDDSDVNNRLNEGLYSQLGRTFYVGYQQTF